MGLGHDINCGERTQDIEISQNVSFDTMLLAEVTLKGLSKAGFLKPSPIQLCGIPLGKCGFDLLLEAKSGTGKTAVFAVIALEKLDLNMGVQTIILAPTREIASQICDVISIIGAYYKGLNVVVVMGGLPMQEDIKKLKKKVHIVVGSPGRLRHLIQDNHIDVSSVRLLVLDEADKLMEQSFLRDINYIFLMLPKLKQVIMSSATYIEETKTFISKYVKKAQHVCPDSSSVLLGIEQKVVILPYNSNVSKQTEEKYRELKKILSSKEFKQCLIFCNYQRRVTKVHKLLTNDKWPSKELYGLQDQHERLGALKTLQEYKCRILISTDLAARGIDASNVDLVVNFEPPYEWQTYLHRIGRAGRYGSYGMAISILFKGEETRKFIHTLSLTNILFKMSDFWSDEPFNNGETADSNHVNNEITATTTFDNDLNKFQEFTIGFSEQRDKVKQEIFSFEELCSSFEKSAIEDVNETNTGDQSFIYKPVKINKVPLKSIENNNYSNSRYSKLNLKDEESLDIEKEQSNAANLLNVSKIMCNNKINNLEENEQQIDINVEDSNENANSYGMEMNESKYSATELALIEAGLPIAFGKTNNKKLIKRNIKNYQSDNIKKTSDTKKVTHKHQTGHHYNDREINRMESSIIANNKKSNYQLGVEDNDSVNNSQDSDSSLNTNYNLRFGLPQTKKSTHNMNTKYSNQSCDSSKGKPRSNEFDIWYNQLRMQSQFIQNALYIAELQKL